MLYKYLNKYCAYIIAIAKLNILNKVILRINYKTRKKYKIKSKNNKKYKNTFKKTYINSLACYMLKMHLNYIKK